MQIRPKNQGIMATGVHMVMVAKRKKKILFVSGSNKPIPATSGGAIEFLTQKLLDFNKINEDIVDFYVLSSSSEYLDDPKNGLFYYEDSSTILYKSTIYLTKFMNRLNKHHQKYTQIKPSLLAKLKKLVDNYKFDEVIMLNYGIYCPKIRDFYSGKLSLYLHNDYLNYFSYEKSKIQRSVDRIISVSPFINERVKEVIEQSEKPILTIVENGIDTTNYFPVTKKEKQSIRTRLEISTKKKVILFSGRIDRSKGITYLVDALEKLSNDQLLLLVVGSISNRKIEDILKRTSIDLKLVEHVSQKEMPQYYQLSDICVIPSTVQESFCLVNMEAQACGVPVITTDAGALNNYFFGDENLKISCNPKNLSSNLSKAITYFFKNEQLIKKIDYRSNAENYSLEKMYQSMICEVIK
ncbi:glycosyltransferase family 4 protein [Enterococcus hirae]